MNHILKTLFIAWLDSHVVAYHFPWTSSFPFVSLWSPRNFQTLWRFFNISRRLSSPSKEYNALQCPMTGRGSSSSNSSSNSCGSGFGFPGCGGPGRR